MSEVVVASDQSTLPDTNHGSELLESVPLSRVPGGNGDQTTTTTEMTSTTRTRRDSQTPIGTLRERSGDGDHLPIIEGMLRKKSPTFPFQWQERHFVLTTREMSYFKVGGVTPQGSIPFTSCKKCTLDVLDEVSQKLIRIEDYVHLNSLSTTIKYFNLTCHDYDGRKRVYELKIPKADKKRCHQWIGAVFRAICCYKVPLSLPKGEELCRYQLLEDSNGIETGDIILMKEKAKNSQLLRLPTGERWFSESDRVGIFLINEQNETLVVWMDPESGFSVEEWEHWDAEKYARVLIRRLILPSTFLGKTINYTKGVEKLSAFLQALQLRANNRISRGYDFSLLECFGQNRSLESENQDFSQPRFVAACLYHLGALTEEATTAAFTIDNFENGKLPLIDGASLGPMKRIVFDHYWEGPIRDLGIDQSGL